MNHSNQKNSAQNCNQLSFAFETFRSECKKILDDWHSVLRKQSVPPHVYHYTNDKGLMGILESGKLWFTDIFSLNDPSELRHGVSLAIKKFGIMAENISKKHAIISRKFREIFDEGVLINDGIQGIAHFFTCSFSKCGDDLGQWRAYADNGHGFALCFDVMGLENVFVYSVTTDKFARETFPLVYDDSRLVEVHEKLIDNTLAYIQVLDGAGIPEMPEELLRDNLRQLYIELAKYIVTISIYFKHAGYANEVEYRFFELHVAGSRPEVRFRARNNSLVKYREFDWKSAGADVLRKIVIGPAANFEKSKEFAEECLRRAGFDPASIEITQSKIPYQPA